MDISAMSPQWRDDFKAQFANAASSNLVRTNQPSPQ
jgi:hypothetical protein